MQTHKFKYISEHHKTYHFENPTSLGVMVNRGLERRFFNVQIHSDLYSNMLTSIHICLNPFNFKLVVSFVKMYFNTTPHCHTQTTPYHIKPYQTMPDHTKHYPTTPDNEQTTPNHTTQLRQQQQPTTPNQTKHNKNTDRDRNSKPKYNLKTTNLNTSIQTRSDNSVEIIWKIFGNKLDIILEGAGQDVIDMQNVLSRNNSRMFYNRSHPNTAHQVRF
jgi:hypothetical protein